VTMLNWQDTWDCMLKECRGEVCPAWPGDQEACDHAELAGHLGLHVEGVQGGGGVDPLLCVEEDPG